MKSKVKILIALLLFIASGSIKVEAIDYYPELGLNPFYSELNPAYINKEDSDVKQDTLINLLKRKRAEKCPRNAFTRREETQRCRNL